MGKIDLSKSTFLILFLAVGFMVGMSFSSVYAGIPWGTDDIADDAITSDKIKNKQVKNADIRGNTIKSGKIRDGTIQGADIGLNTITKGHLTDNSVNTGKILDGTITLEDLADLSFPDIYIKREIYSIDPGGSNSFATESCDQGDMLLNGGVRTSGGSNQLEIFSSYPAPTTEGSDNLVATNMWVGGARNLANSGSGIIIVHVTCWNTNP